ncbi:hypothetical protein PRZ48_009167 [Zasmidium cellare]|uniref:Zn(2)-C6 fungal-type domain-containing protein n=1 Tax=Zasmidium cellare TaxID=395010 RepID=A0ABR0EB13_ZASCE|nr:hypothetical protein PRZ48_009167 [Zasmidium cellare]
MPFNSSDRRDSHGSHGTPKLSRQRPGSACVACRTRKIRCDGQQPSCSTCISTGVICQQPETPGARRGPKKGHMKALQQRVQNLELELSAVRTYTDGDRMSIAQQTPINQPTSGEERPSMATRSSSFSGSGSGSSGVHGEDSVDTDFSWEEFSSMLSPATSISFDPFDALMSMPVAESSLPENIEVHNWNFPSPSAALPLHRSFDQLFLERVHPVLLLHHRRRYASWANSDTKTKAQEALQMTLWTLVSAQSVRLSHSSPMLYSQARAALSAWQTAGHGGSVSIDVAWIQAHVVIAIYEALCMDLQLAGMTLTYCLRLMQVQQWHRLDADESCLAHGESLIDKEEKRRTFWLAFALDRFISLACRLPVTLSDEVIFTRLPASEHDFQSMDMAFVAPMPFASEALKCPESTQFSPLAEMAAQAVIAGRGLAQLQTHHGFDNPRPDYGDVGQRRRCLRNLISAHVDSVQLHDEDRGPIGIFNTMLTQMNVLCLWLSADGQEQLGSQQAANAAAQEIVKHSRMLVEWSYLELHPFTPLPLFICADYLRNRSSVDMDASTKLTEVLVQLQHMASINNVAKNYVLNWNFGDDTSGCTAAGYGKALAQAFVAAGAFVTIGDIDQVALEATVAGLGRSAHGVLCDVTNWAQQVELFEQAIEKSPSKAIDIVIANAGLGAGAGDPFAFLDEQDLTVPPPEPDLKITKVNLHGTLYTARLALHYFRRFQANVPSDRSLILISSMAAYLDYTKSLQYPVSKAGVRNIMKCLRRSTWKQAVRVNAVAPSFLDTGMVAPDVKAKLQSFGVEFAALDDAVKAVMKISTDVSVNGRTLTIADKVRAPHGYQDLNHDDYKKTDYLHLMERLMLDMPF